MIILVNCLGGTEKEFIKNSLNINTPYEFTTEDFNERKIDEKVFIPELHFLRKVLHKDFLAVLYDDGNLRGISKFKIDKKHKDLPKIIFADDDFIHLLRNKFKSIGIQVKTLLITYPEDEKIHKMGVIHRISHRRLEEILAREEHIDIESYDEVIDGKYETDVIDFINNLINNDKD